jgi:hypothetical protein
MRKLLLAAAAALCVAAGGCSNVVQTLQTDWSIVTGASVSPNAVYVAANAFDVVEATATTYLKFPPCSAGASLLCRSPIAVAAIVPAIRSGRQVRSQLEADVFTPSAQAPTPASALTLLQSATSTIRSILAEYSITVTP